MRFGREHCTRLGCRSRGSPRIWPHRRGRGGLCAFRIFRIRDLGIRQSGILLVGQAIFVGMLDGIRNAADQARRFAGRLVVGYGWKWSALCMSRSNRGREWRSQWCNRFRKCSLCMFSKQFSHRLLSKREGYAIDTSFNARAEVLRLECIMGTKFPSSFSH